VPLPADLGEFTVSVGALGKVRSSYIWDFPVHCHPFPSSNNIIVYLVYGQASAHTVPTELVQSRTARRTLPRKMDICRTVQ
jgi:hypothetical protein